MITIQKHKILQKNGTHQRHIIRKISSSSLVSKIALPFCLTDIAGFLIFFKYEFGTFPGGKWNLQKNFF